MPNLVCLILETSLKVDATVINKHYFAGSLVYPKLVQSVHYCQVTKKFIERKYTDLTSLEAVPTSAVYPTKVGKTNFTYINYNYT